jgi:hypothetical protein
VAVGGVYSYYEFWQDAELGRLTDEEWRAMLDNGEAPDRPAWQLPIFAGTESRTTAGLAAGLFCRDIEAAGYSFDQALAYWVREGTPSRMDADGNGIPCETLYSAGDVNSVIGASAGFGPDLFCYHLVDRGAGFGEAVAYWVSEGVPDRMDADGNGIPCETVYDAAEVADFLWFDR